MAVNTSSEDYIRGVSDGFVRGIASKGVLTVGTGGETVPYWLSAQTADESVNSYINISFTSSFKNVEYSVCSDTVISNHSTVTFGGVNILENNENILHTVVDNSKSIDNMSFIEALTLFNFEPTYYKYMSGSLNNDILYFVLGKSDLTVDEISNGDEVNIISELYIKYGSKYSDYVTAFKGKSAVLGKSPTLTNNLIADRGIFRYNIVWVDGNEPEPFDTIQVYKCKSPSAGYGFSVYRDLGISISSYEYGYDRYREHIYIYSTDSNGYPVIKTYSLNGELLDNIEIQRYLSTNYLKNCVVYNGNIYSFYSNAIYKVTPGADGKYEKIITLSGVGTYFTNMSVLDNKLVLLTSNRSGLTDNNNAVAIPSISIYSLDDYSIILQHTFNSKYNGHNIITNSECTKLYMQYRYGSNDYINGIVEYDVNSGEYVHCKHMDNICQFISSEVTQGDMLGIYAAAYCSKRESNLKLYSVRKIGSLANVKMNNETSGINSGGLNLVVDINFG